MTDISSLLEDAGLELSYPFDHPMTKLLIAIHIQGYEQGKRDQVIDKSAAKRIATMLGWEPKREWVGLTDDEYQEIYRNHTLKHCGDVWDYEHGIEAKLKEKNV
jgi:hypothetical protein